MISSEYNFQCCGVKLPEYKCIVICIYRIPNSNPHIFLQNLEIVLGKYRTKSKKKIIILGDFNINLM